MRIKTIIHDNTVLKLNMKINIIMIMRKAITMTTVSPFCFIPSVVENAVPMLVYQRVYH